MTRKNLSKLERVPLREAWKHEAHEFTPWLAETDNLNTMAEVLGLSELELVATEHWVGDFKLDILCTDGDGQVIIENQLEKTNHTHLGQIISYAAGVGAKKVIWVAESFRPEHSAALQFLNDHTTDDLNFFAVEIELWRIGDSPLAPKFEVVVKPNEWAKAGREMARAAASTTPTKQLQQKFWTVLVEHLASKATHIRPQKPRPQHWLTNSIGRSGFALNPTVNTRHQRLGVELYISDQDAKQYYSKLLERKEDIESRLGFEMDWQELPESGACRIASYCQGVSIEDETRWNEYINWLTQRLVKMNEVLRPIVKTL